MYDLFSHQTKSMYYLLVFLELSPTFIAFYYKSCTLHTCIEESKPTFRCRIFPIARVNPTLHGRNTAEIIHLCIAHRGIRRNITTSHAPKRPVQLLIFPNGHNMTGSPPPPTTHQGVQSHLQPCDELLMVVR